MIKHVEVSHVGVCVIPIYVYSGTHSFQWTRALLCERSLSQNGGQCQVHSRKVYATFLSLT